MPPVAEENKLVRVIAARDFRNTHPKSIDLGEEALHPHHVHKGAEFALDKEDDADLLVQLASSGSIVELCEKNKDLLEQLKAEIIADEKLRRADAEAAKASTKNSSAVFEQFLAWLQANGKK